MKRMTAKEYISLVESGKIKPKKRHKYNAKKKTIDGHTFDSTKEANRYLELRQLERAGVIKGLELQPAYPLTDTIRHNGKTYRKSSYKADFRYTKDGKTIVEDVKGYKTDLYRFKIKVFLSKYGGQLIFKET